MWGQQGIIYISCTFLIGSLNINDAVDLMRELDPTNPTQVAQCSSLSVIPQNGVSDG